MRTLYDAEQVGVTESRVLWVSEMEVCPPLKEPCWDRRKKLTSTSSINAGKETFI